MRRFNQSSWLERAWAGVGGRRMGDSRPLSTFRRLSAELLETRYALSGMGGDPPAVPSMVPPDTVQMPINSPANSPITAPLQNPPPESPPATDAPPVTLPPTGGAGTGGGGASPVISNYGDEHAGGWHRLYGLVTDDLDPTGLTVYFGGLMTGSVLVGAADTFSMLFEISPSVHGTIGAYTMDIDGHLSNFAVFNV